MYYTAAIWMHLQKSLFCDTDVKSIAQFLFCFRNVHNYYYKVTQIKGMVISHKITDFQNKKSHKSALFCQKVHAQHLGGHMGAFNIPRPIHLIRYTQQKDRSGGREKLRVIVSVNY